MSRKTGGAWRPRSRRARHSRRPLVDGDSTDRARRRERAVACDREPEVRGVDRRPVGGELSGKKIVFTGGLTALSRSEAKKLVEEYFKLSRRAALASDAAGGEAKLDTDLVAHGAGARRRRWLSGWWRRDGE